MDYQLGDRLECNLKADLGKWGEYPFVAIITIDGDSSFHGVGFLQSETLDLFGITLDPGKRIEFKFGEIDGDTFKFGIKKKGIAVRFQVHVDGTMLTGTATAVGLLSASLEGYVSSVKKA